MEQAVIDSLIMIGLNQGLHQASTSGNWLWYLVILIVQLGMFKIIPWIISRERKITSLERDSQFKEIIVRMDKHESDSRHQFNIYDHRLEDQATSLKSLNDLFCSIIKNKKTA